MLSRFTKTLEFFPVGKVALFRSIQPLFVVIGSILPAYLHTKHALIVKRPWRSPRA